MFVSHFWEREKVKRNGQEKGVLKRAEREKKTDPIFRKGRNEGHLKKNFFFAVVDFFFVLRKKKKENEHWGKMVRQITEVSYRKGIFNRQNVVDMVELKESKPVLPIPFKERKRQTEEEIDNSNTGLVLVPPP